MKLYVTARAPNPRRVRMFLAEKGVLDRFEQIEVDLNQGAHREPAFRALNPFARVPVLVLDDGRVLSESRAICLYLESLFPEPLLFGSEAFERARIEEADRRAELALLLTVANAVRHGHPGLAALERPQFPDFAAAQRQRLSAVARRFDALLASQPYLAGEQFSVADITAFCAIEFAKLAAFRPADEGLAHLSAWRDRIAARPSAGMC